MGNKIFAWFWSLCFLVVSFFLWMDFLPIIIGGSFLDR